MCLECSGKHRGLGVRISFVRSVSMDSWSEIQLKKMQAGGNAPLNSFLAQYGIPKETDIVAKYNSKAVAVYRDRIQALAEGRSWNAPAVVKESVGTGSQGGGRTSSGGGIKRGGNGWDDWDDEPSRSHSRGDMYTKSQLEQSAAGKESFFARKQMENASRPDNLPPSQGGKYVGFGWGVGRPPQARGPPLWDDVLNESLSELSQGFNPAIAASAAQNAASVLQASTTDIQAKVREGGYDQKVNETMSVVAAKGTEVGQKAWGFMRGVMAMASQQVEAYTKDGLSSSSNQSLDSRGGSVGYQELNGNYAWGAPAKSNDGLPEWEDSKEPKPQTTTVKETGLWAGWDDHEDDHRLSNSSKMADDGWGDDSWEIITNDCRR